jgi:hypothetical protein
MSELWERAARLHSVQTGKRIGLRIVESLEIALAKKPNWVFAICALFALQFALIFTHEPWLDEWQALQLALQAPSVADLLSYLHYEGHPPPWYLILRSLARVIDPFWVLPITAAVLAAITQSTILFASPFSRAVRLLMASSCFMMFEFMTLSRSMTLGVCLLILAMAFWQRRAVWLVIAFLPLCDFLFGVLSGVLLLLQWRDRGLWLPGVLAWLVLSGLSAWTVLPAPDMIQALELHGPPADFANYLMRLGVLLIPLQMNGMVPEWDQPPPVLFAAILGMLFLLFAWFQTRHDRLHQILFWGFLGLTFVFSMVVYPLHARHLMLIALLLMLLVWRRAAEGFVPSSGFKLWLLGSTVCGLIVAVTNFIVPFDSAWAAAREIQHLGLADKHWLVFPDSRAQGVAAIMEKDFERAEHRCMQSFVRWNFRTKLLNYPQLTSYLRKEVNDRGKFYMLSDYKLALPHDLAHQIGHIPAGYNGQNYYFYELGPGMPDAQVNLPRCVPNQRPLRAAHG